MIVLPEPDGAPGQRRFTLVHIVPGLVPGACGLGDYAVTLAQGLAGHGIDSRFVVAGHELAHRSDDHDPRGAFPVRVIGQSIAALRAALSDLDPDCILLHYSPYGYDRTGHPAWLVKALRAHRVAERARIVTVFHETWQRPRLLRRSLYRAAFQRRLALRLCRISDTILTNTKRRAAWLGRHHPAGCRALPVFSNVGEAGSIPKTTANAAIIFGLARRRAETWARLAERPELIDRFDLQTLIDVGDGDGDVAIPPVFAEMTTVYGKRSDAAVSALLARTRFAFLSYERADLAKSGVFAAFAAHRICVVTLDAARDGRSDDLVAGVHFLAASGARPTEATVDGIAANLLAWYEPHGVAQTIAAIADILRSAGMR